MDGWSVCRASFDANLTVPQHLSLDYTSPLLFDYTPSPPVLRRHEISAVCARIACDLLRPVAYGSIQVHTYAYSSFVAYTCLDSNFLMHTTAM